MYPSGAAKGNMSPVLCCIFISAKWTEWMAEILFSFDVCLSVRSGQSWESNANSSKTVKATDFKFDTRVPRDSPDMNTKIFPKRGVAMVTWRDPLNFWVLNTNSSKTVKATDFKFDKRVPRDSPDKIAKNFPKRGRGHGHVTP